MRFEVCWENGEREAVLGSSEPCSASRIVKRLLSGDGGHFTIEVLGSEPRIGEFLQVLYSRSQRTILIEIGLRNNDNEHELYRLHDTYTENIASQRIEDIVTRFSQSDAQEIIKLGQWVRIPRHVYTRSFMRAAWLRASFHHKCLLVASVALVAASLIALSFMRDPLLSEWYIVLQFAILIGTVAAYYLYWRLVDIANVIGLTQDTLVTQDNIVASDEE